MLKIKGGGGLKCNRILKAKQTREKTNQREKKKRLGMKNIIADQQ